MEPLGPALANTVAGTYPVASASSSVAYVYNPRLEAFERRTGVLGRSSASAPRPSARVK